MKMDELRVSTNRFVSVATDAEWGYSALCIVWSMAGKPLPDDSSRWLDLPIDSVRYMDLIKRLDGSWRLAAVDSLAGVDGVRVGGTILLAMANRIFLPHVPLNHAARKPTEALLARFSAWLLDGEAAEAYIGEAYRYRSRFGTTITAIGTDQLYEELFDAMPSAGLDNALGEGYWDLSRHWRNFGRFLGAHGDDWKALEELRDAAEETMLVSNTEGDDEAQNKLNELIDEHLGRCIDNALEAYDSTLCELVDGMLASLCNTAPARS